MLDLFVSAFVTLFVVIDPLGCAPIFAGLTAGASAVQSRQMAIKATVVAAAILVVFALFGEQLLSALHIQLDAFRIAGGIMLFLIALEMVFERRTQRREERADKVRAHNERAPQVEDISVFPMAMPMIAGPGSIATVMLLMSRAEGTPQTLVILAALLATMLLCLLALLAGPALMRLVGASVEAVVTRLLGVLLSALAAQYVIDGVKTALAG
jgi:multiple antibiotic resistance protein